MSSFGLKAESASDPKIYKRAMSSFGLKAAFYTNLNKMN